MADPSEFERLIQEGRQVPVDGWDFSWFGDRASEARPPWGYQRLVADRLGQVADVIDLQTGGGEVLAGALQLSRTRPGGNVSTDNGTRRDSAARTGGADPGRVTATESWPPNLELARRALAPWRGRVIDCPNDDVPVADASQDLVLSRHPVTTPWTQIARVLRPGGSFLSQQVGAGSVRELTEAMIGRYEITERFPEQARQRATDAGLEVVRLETASLPMAFNDIAAVVVFLRKVIWTVPDFSVEKYHPQLRALHERIETEGPFRATSERFLIECRKPPGAE